MGIIISAVDVLEIHIEMKAVVSMKPNTIARGRSPTRASTLSAMRRCRFQRSMASAVNDPPSSSITIGLA